MILKTVRIENFKCIEDSNEFRIDQVTCLVGKNESGKTTLLQALYKFNPDIKEQADFNYVEEYPRRHLSDYEEKLKSGGKQDNVLTTVWELNDTEKKALETLIPQATKISTVKIRKGYDNKRHWEVSLNEGEVVDHLLKTSGLHQEEADILKGVKTVSELLEKLKAVGSPSERHTAFQSRVQGAFPEGNLSTAIAKILEPFLPRFLYFTTYERLPGEVAIDDLLTREQEKRLKSNDQVFLALMNLAGSTPKEIKNIGQFEPFIAKLEAISNKITEEIFTYWSQNKHLDVEFHFDAARPQDSPPFNQGYIFRTRIKNRRHRVTVGFDERSSGFVWFFSFLVWFSQVRRTYGENLFILLDEPGLTLHARAQADLLRYINEKLQPHYQVVYTTHSPFMIDPENLLSARTVEDVVMDGAVEGTKVGGEVLSTDADTVFPLQACLGYDITQTLFVGKDVLLVEGPSDLLYLKWFSQELRARGREGLDNRWVITPSGGVEKVASFLSLFGGNRLHVAVLTDLHQGLKTRVRNLKESELLRQGHVFTADMYAGQEEADIEDVIGRSTYVSLVNQCYALAGKTPIPEKKPSDASIRVIEEVEKHFRTLPADVVEFDHFRPATFLVEKTADLRTKLPQLDEALDRFERLFKDLNRLLPAQSNVATRSESDFSRR